MVAHLPGMLVVNMGRVLVTVASVVSPEVSLSHFSPLFPRLGSNVLHMKTTVMSVSLLANNFLSLTSLLIPLMLEISLLMPRKMRSPIFSPNAMFQMLDSFVIRWKTVLRALDMLNSRLKKG